MKRTNNTFHGQIQDLEKRHGKSWPAYPVHLRCLGLVQRSGPLVVKMLPPRVTLPKARPPVESAAEICHTRQARVTNFLCCGTAKHAFSFSWSQNLHAASPLVRRDGCPREAARCVNRQGSAGLRPGHVSLGFIFRGFFLPRPSSGPSATSSPQHMC